MIYAIYVLFLYLYFYSISILSSLAQHVLTVPFHVPTPAYLVTHKANVYPCGLSSIIIDIITLLLYSFRIRDLDIPNMTSVNRSCTKKEVIEQIGYSIPPTLLMTRWKYRYNKKKKQRCLISIHKHQTMCSSIGRKNCRHMKVAGNPYSFIFSTIPFASCNILSRSLFTL